MGEYKFFTTFDDNYLIRGIAMIKSVNEHSNLRINWTVLALTNNVAVKVREFLGEEIQIIFVSDLGSPVVNELESIRPYREFCWSLSAILLQYATLSSDENDVLSYIDSDCYFFGDVKKILKLLNSRNEIVIHKHNYSADLQYLEETNGTFNVGLIAGVNGNEFKTCIDRWAKQVIAFCGIDVERGMYGDQTYLNEWPNLYKSLTITKSLGVGLAPWNVGKNEVTFNDGVIKIESDEVIFYHFHALKVLPLSNEMALFFPALNYKIGFSVINLIYRIYVRELMRIRSKIGKDFQVSGKPAESVRAFIYSRFRQQTIFYKYSTSD